MGEIKQAEIALVLPFEGDMPGTPEVMLSEEMMRVLALGIGSKVEVRNPRNEERIVCSVAFPDKADIAKIKERGAGGCVLLEIGIIRKLKLARTPDGYSCVLLFPDLKGGPA